VRMCEHQVLCTNHLVRTNRLVLTSVGNNIRLLQYYCNISYCNIIAIQYMVIRISCNTILELSIPIYIADYYNIGIAFFCHFGTCEL
jgi:hypothetical protein